MLIITLLLVLRPSFSSLSFLVLSFALCGTYVSLIKLHVIYILGAGNIYLMRVLIHSLNVLQGWEVLTAAKSFSNHVTSSGWICFIALASLIKRLSFIREHLPDCLSPQALLQLMKQKWLDEQKYLLYLLTWIQWNQTLGSLISVQLLQMFLFLFLLIPFLKLISFWLVQKNIFY